MHANARLLECLTRLEEDVLLIRLTKLRNIRAYDVSPKIRTGCKGRQRGMRKSMKRMIYWT